MTRAGIDVSQRQVERTRAFSAPSWRPRWAAAGAAVGVVAALILAAVAWQLGRQIGSPHSRRPPAHTSVRAPATAPAFVPFRDPAGAFGGSYPAGWHLLTPANPAVVLIATGPDGASMLVRKAELSAPVSSANLGAALNLTDRVVTSAPHVVLLRRPQRVTLGGLPGYLYLYTFENGSSRQRGAHAQYFLFDGKLMITLVFQALPAARIYSLAPLFDRIAGTLRVGSPL